MTPLLSSSVPTLGFLLPEIALSPQAANLSVGGLQLDSRLLQPGDVFLAYPGVQSDGRDYMAAAVQAGAVAILAEARGLSKLETLPVPVIPVVQLQHQASAIAGRFYGDPSRELHVTGITGTNGKTTCSHLLGQLYSALGEHAGVLGTLGYGLVAEGQPPLETTGLTTPDALSTQRILSDLKTAGARWVAMEVSSHSLHQGRVAAIRFNTALFTNLSRDHLDYHGDLESYGAAKAALFQVPSLEVAVINQDDGLSRQIAASLPGYVRCYRYAILDATADSYATRVHLDERGIRAEVVTPWGMGEINSSLLGDFNLSNLLAVVTTACAQGFSLEKVLAAVPQLKPVAGRMELVDPAVTPTVVVDYAHTPDALEKALQALRGHCQGELWCVFGCGGDRDRGKRPAMGAVAECLADRVIVTSDNPRSENPQSIIDDILGGMKDVARATVWVDRREAIVQAIRQAGLEDAVLIAGKGHEDYQQLGSRKLPFSDIAEARLALRERQASTQAGRGRTGLGGDREHS